MITFNFHPFPELATARLLLKKITLADAQDLFELRKDVAAMRYLDRDPPTEINQIHELIFRIDEGIEKNESISWGLFLKEGNKFIGTIGYYRSKPEHHRSEIGYMLAPAYWRKGLISEAMAAAINYGFSEMKLHSIEADVNPANTASIKTLEKFKFIKEAHFKENYYYNGKYMDTAIYSLLQKYLQNP